MSPFTTGSLSGLKVNVGPIYMVSHTIEDTPPSYTSAHTISGPASSPVISIQILLSFNPPPETNVPCPFEVSALQ